MPEWLHVAGADLLSALGSRRDEKGVREKAPALLGGNRGDPQTGGLRGMDRQRGLVQKGEHARIAHLSLPVQVGPAPQLKHCKRGHGRRDLFSHYLLEQRAGSLDPVSVVQKYGRVEKDVSQDEDRLHSALRRTL